MVRQDFHAIGRNAARLLLDRIEGRVTTDRARSTHIMPLLVARHSTSAPKKAPRKKRPEKRPESPTFALLLTMSIEARIASDGIGVTKSFKAPYVSSFIPSRHPRLQVPSCKRNQPPASGLPRALPSSNYWS
jgi:hypothetical protein